MYIIIYIICYELWNLGIYLCQNMATVFFQLIWYSIWLLMIHKLSSNYNMYLWLRKTKNCWKFDGHGHNFYFTKWKVQVWVTEFLRFIARNNSRHTNLCTRTTTTTYDDTTLYVDGVLCNIIIWAWLKNVKKRHLSAHSNNNWDNME